MISFHASTESQDIFASATSIFFYICLLWECNTRLPVYPFMSTVGLGLGLGLRLELEMFLRLDTKLGDA